MNNEVIIKLNQLLNQLNVTFVYTVDQKTVKIILVLKD
jgi:hypothetical protein